jgi:hypothetical protein
MPSRYQVFALDRTFNCSDVNKNQKAEAVNLKVFDHKFLRYIVVCQLKKKDNQQIV